MKSRSLTALTTCVAFAGAMLWPYVARAQQPPPTTTEGQPTQPGGANGDDVLAQAKQHFEAGKNAYNAGDYQTAIHEFKAAEALRPSPILDYNIGLANEKLGKKRVAIKYYRRYLDGMPNATNRAQVEASIGQLQQEIDAAPPPSPQQQQQQMEQPSDLPPPVAPSAPSYSGYDPYASTPPPYSVPPPQHPKKKSYWWVALIVVGGVLLISAIIAAAVIYGIDTSTAVAGDHALTSPPRAPPQTTINGSQRSPGVGATLFTF